MTVRGGSVYLIGAGPGDPGLITVRGREILERADVVVHDRLVSPALLRCVRGDAEVIDVGKAPYRHRVAQARINELLVAHARTGRAVARLKGGDPYVFGRGSEERDACRRAGVPCEVVPGISSAIAGPALADVPVTRRGVARGFAVVTARAGAGALVDLGPWAAVDTLVVLMGMEVLEEIADGLIAAGRGPDTPVAIVERAGLSGEHVLRGRLDEIAARARAAGAGAPAVIVVGAVAAEDDPLPAAPLSGHRVAVTRPRDAGHELTRGLRDLGASVAWVPLIEIEPVEAGTGWIDACPGMDWIVVASRHGARGLCRALAGAGRDARALGAARLAAVGPTTARELAAGGLRADLVPPVARVHALVASLRAAGPAGARVLFVRGSLGADVVPARLRAAGMRVEEVSVYETRLLEPPPGPRDRLAAATIVLFAAPSAVEAYVRLELEPRGRTAICIGAATAQAARAAGFDVHVAAAHSDAGLLQRTVEVCLASGAHR